MYDVHYYETCNGDCPFLSFYKDLDTVMQAKMLREIDLLEEFGPLLREPHSKPMADGVLELRVKVATNITRVFYFFVTGKKIIITNGYVKKTQKTNKRELKRAISYKRDYEARS